MIHIAAIAPDPGIAWNTILTWAVVVPLVAALISLIRIGKPQKREVTFSDAYVTKEHCGTEHRHSLERIGNCESEIREIRKEVQALVRTINESATTHAKDMQSEITRLRMDVNESLRRVHTRIDDIPAQVIATLKNTGALD